MHKYKISNAKIMVLLALICCTGSISIAQIIKPVAHYPLEAELLNRKFSANKLKVYRPGYWDVSGNGYHGELVQGNTKLFSNEGVLDYYDVDSFLLGKPCMKKIAATPEESPVNFQVPANLSNQLWGYEGVSFTVAFWIKPGSANGIILSLPLLRISLENGIPVMNYQFNKTIQKFSSLRQLTIDEWSLVAFTFDSEYQTGYFHINSYISGLNEQLFETNHYDTGFLLGDVEDMSSDHYIFGTTFTGSLSNIRFYPSPLTGTDIGRLKAIDVKWNSPDWSTKLGDNIKDWENHALKGASLYYPLSGNANELVKHKNGTINGVSYTAVKGRFGANSNSLALSMSDNTYIDLPDKLFDTEQKTEAGEKLFRGVTLSYWIKVPVFPVNEAKGAERPFTPQQLSTPTRLLHARDAQNRVLYGMDVVNDRLGNMRYSWDASNNLYNWFAWYYDPVSFSGNAADQWYHVIQVADNTYMKTYMYKLGVDEFCTKNFDPNKKHDHCTCSYSFLGIQSLADATKWGLGNFAGKNYPMSDFHVYNWPMTKFEVMTLHTLESIDGNPVAPVAKRVTNEEVITGSATAASEMTVYPNPATNDVTISLYSKAEGKVSVMLKDFTGRLVFSSVYTVSAGNRQINIDLKKYGLTKGVYLLQVTGAEVNKTVKLVKQ